MAKASLSPRGHLAVSVCLILLIIFSLNASAWAERATPSEMDRVCQNWLTLKLAQDGSWAGSSQPSIQAFQDMTIDNEVLGRCYHIAPQGYIFVTAIKGLPAVKAYSDEFTLDINDQGGTAALLKDMMTARAEAYRQDFGNLDAPFVPGKSDRFSVDQYNSWYLYALEEKEFGNNINTLKMDAKDQAGPLISTVWHQGSPYNNYCPLGDGGRCVSGCVATAAAQIMWFWQWPPIGYGSHTYFWPGDYCTGGGTPQNLTANYWDTYNWSSESADNVAEINYEAGIAYNMEYGYCASGAYMSPTPTVFPNYFRYKTGILQRNRTSFTIGQWFAMIQIEINAGRPILFGMTQHAVVCDGWQTGGTYNLYHMNYGWGGPQNTWYVLDNYHCPVEECSQSNELMFTGLQPDRDIMLYADTTFGPVPFDVNFTGSSELTVDSWNWTFGDGGSGEGQYPLHTFEQPGIYNIGLQLTAGATNKSMTAQNFIVVTADSMIGYNVEGSTGSTVEIPIYARNIVPLNSIKIPLEYTGDLVLEYDTFVTTGCRTDYFEYKQKVATGTNAVTLLFTNSTSGTQPELEPGTGLIAKVRFRVISGTMGAQTTIVTDGWYTHQPTFYSPLYRSYRPELVFPTVTFTFLCGDVTNDALINILDIIYLIDFKFKGGPAPAVMESADVNGDSLVNILDIIYLIDFKFKGGPEPDCL